MRELEGYDSGSSDCILVFLYHPLLSSLLSFFYLWFLVLFLCTKPFLFQPFLRFIFLLLYWWLYNLWFGYLFVILVLFTSFHVAYLMYSKHLWVCWFVFSLWKAIVPQLRHKQPHRMCMRVFYYFNFHVWFFLLYLLILISCTLLFCYLFLFSSLIFFSDWHSFLQSFVAACVSFDPLSERVLYISYSNIVSLH